MLCTAVLCSAALADGDASRALASWPLGLLASVPLGLRPQATGHRPQATGHEHSISNRTPNANISKCAGHPLSTSVNAASYRCFALARHERCLSSLCRTKARKRGGSCATHQRMLPLACSVPVLGLPSAQVSRR